MIIPTNLEFRILKSHLDSGMINSVGLPMYIGGKNDWASFVNHVDYIKTDKRRNAAISLLKNVESSCEVDLTPLKDDQRVAGYANGDIQDIFEMVCEYGQRFPDHIFNAKWGFKPNFKGRYTDNKNPRFVFYVENEKESDIVIARLNKITSLIGLELDLSHNYGLEEYKKHLDIDDNFKSEVREKEELVELISKIYKV